MREVDNYDDQLRLWLTGEFVHIRLLGRGAVECCPDFACCNDKIDTPQETREAFVRADKITRHGMLMTFLGAALATMGDDAPKVHIAGDPTNYQEEQ